MYTCTRVHVHMCTCTVHVVRTYMNVQVRSTVHVPGTCSTRVKGVLIDSVPTCTCTAVHTYSLRTVITFQLHRKSSLLNFMFSPLCDVFIKLLKTYLFAYMYRTYLYMYMYTYTHTCTHIHVHVCFTCNIHYVYTT